MRTTARCPVGTRRSLASVPRHSLAQRGANLRLLAREQRRPSRAHGLLPAFQPYDRFTWPWLPEDGTPTCARVGICPLRAHRDWGERPRPRPFPRPHLTSRITAVSF